MTEQSALGGNLYITTCVHGVDLRFTPRCYLCRPETEGTLLISEPIKYRGTVDRNVAKLARPRRIVRADVLIPDAAQSRALIAAAMGKARLDNREPAEGHRQIQFAGGNPEPSWPAHRLGALIVAALGTGLRQGELLGLTRDCLDLDAGTARIDWTLTWVAGDPVLALPKTASSRRVVPLPPFVVAALKSHLARQAEERLAAGRKWRDADGFLFTTAEGRPVSGNTARWVLDKLCEQAGLPHVRFHSLRHAAVQLVTEGAGQKAAQTLAGHSSIQTTDIYTHPSDSLARAAAAALERELG